MLRKFAIACLLVSAPLAAQAAAPRPFVLLLRDPSNNPVANARVWLAERPAWCLAALPAPLPAAFGDVLPRVSERRADSDAQGRVRIPRAATGSGDAVALVTTDRGLGALVHLHAGRARRVTLRPMAEIGTATASESFELHATVDLPGFGRQTLPVRRVRSARLPAGGYEVWAHSPDGWIWRDLQLVDGRRAVLDWTGSAQRLAVPPGAIVQPANLAGVVLNRPGEELILRGAALAAPLVTWHAGRISLPATVPGPPRNEARPWPPASTPVDADHTTVACSDPTAHAVLVRTEASGRFTLLAHATVRDGQLQLPAAAPGDSWLLLLAEGRAPAAWPWTARNRQRTFACPSGSPLQVEARDERGLPVTGLELAFVPDGQPCAEVRTHTDFDGAARCGPTTGPGVLLVRDERFANQRIELDRIPADTLAVTAATGATVRGVAKFGDGVVPATIVVTLRDPTGHLQPSTRTRTVRAGEPFTFAGLEHDVDLLLFATARRDGKTWSVRLPTRVPNDDLELVLENEDPVLRPGGRD